MFLSTIRNGESMTTRIIKSHQDITLTEVTQSDGNKIINRAYSVRTARDPTASKQFGDMGAANVYFDQLIMHPKGGLR